MKVLLIIALITFLVGIILPTALELSGADHDSCIKLSSSFGFIAGKLFKLAILLYVIKFIVSLFIH